MKKSLYRITFINQDEIYELYAHSVTESDMFGFLKIEEITFGENHSLVVDPSEEKLKMEFNEVERTYVPVHSIIRIDEVTKRGVAKVKEKASTDATIRHFPTPGTPKA
jgi:hypothetical protein